MVFGFISFILVVCGYTYDTVIKKCIEINNTRVILKYILICICTVIVCISCIEK